MRIAIRYRSAYDYAAAVSFSRHVFRLFPRLDPTVRLEEFRFVTNAGADIQHRLDVWGNQAAVCFYPEKATTLQAELDLVMEVGERNAFHFLLERHAIDFPFHYEAGDRAALAPFLPPGAPAIALPFWQPPREPASTVSTLVDLNSALHDHLGYERREEGDPRSPAETLQVGTGSCRDFAALLVEVFHGLGIAARLVSGYLLEFGEGEHRAEGAMHAWAEAYLPGAGWLGFDPTNGTLCDHHHLPTAAGPTPADIAPITGNYYSPGHVPAAMSSSLAITLC